MTGLEMRAHLLRTAQDALTSSSGGASREFAVPVLQSGSYSVVQVRVDPLQPDFPPSHLTMESFPSASVTPGTEQVLSATEEK
jgi:hypothetical protein